MKDREILEAIGALLWSIFDDEAAQIDLYAESNSALSSNSVEFIRKDGGVFWFSHQNIPHLVLNEVGRHIRQLQQTPPFDNESFTHMKYSLT